ncbi:MAG: cytotoxic translational repressor of toxin-antitoxin stability system [Candidatus Pacebacteria bacterium]|nr:cytotoxic translational repressor of toxin-antitoxin stability system [Candidatus Paceibacterota bacterium]
MTWKINLSKEADRFLVKNRMGKEEIFEIVGNIIKKLQGEDINVDVKKLKGKWLGFYRCRVGGVRIIFEINFDEFSVFIEVIDFRGRVYKK